MRRAALALVAAAALVAGCTSGASSPSASSPSVAGSQAVTKGPPTTLRVLAGSELSDVTPLLGRLRDATGVTLTFSYAGTLDGADRIAHRRAGADVAWFSSDRYLRLLPGGASAAVVRTPIMLSPVVLGVRRSLAQRYGWVGNPDVTWKDIADAVNSRGLTYAMTDPAASNSGFSALVGAAAAFAGTADALTAADIRSGPLTDFFRGQALTAGSSGWLADAYVRDQGRLGGMINYESVLLSLNASGRLREPLTLIYPRDGIVTADYPMLLLDPAKRAAYDRVVAWLRSPSVQASLARTTHRRPVVAGVAPPAGVDRGTLAELPFPATLSVANALLSAYQDRFRRPSHTIFVLDTSGSMAGSRLASLRSALVGLAGGDRSLSGQFTRFRSREHVTLLPFSDGPRPPTEVAFPTTGTEPAAGQVRSFAAGLAAGGNTDLYGALERAYALAAAARSADAGAYTSIVLMTDGENNRGPSAAAFAAAYRALDPATRDVRTFTVLFGDASVPAMRQIAAVTGGAVFDARDGSLSQAFKEIRGYQ